MTQKFAVPAFFGNPNDPNNPDRIYYDTLATTLPAGSIIVLDMTHQDPPGSMGRPAIDNANLVLPFRTRANSYQAIGYIVLGYVSTTIGTGAANCQNAAPPLSNPTLPLPNPARTQSQLTGYVDYWYQAIPELDGIFFDEGPSPYDFTGGPNIGATFPIAQCVKNLYSSIYQHVQTKPVRAGRPLVGGNAGPAVLLNASQYEEEPAGDWIMAGPNRACDIAILWETAGCNYFVTAPAPTNVWPNPAPGWWTNPAYAPDRVAHTIFDCHNTEDMRRAIALSNQRGPGGGLAAGYVFVVDSDDSTYNHLPPYWIEELAAATTPPGTATAEQRQVASRLFCVRDWTDSLRRKYNNPNKTSGIWDSGQEPSTHIFWVTSDVWNRHTNSSGDDPLYPGRFPGNDQPPSEDVQVGTNVLIDNFAFARIHPQYACVRGTTPETVQATFLWADFGTGTNFQDVSPTPSVQVTFNAGDVRNITPGVQWALPDVGSGHICLAVEISASQDPFKVELRGKSSGASGSLVVNDNNMAQRNLGAVKIMNLQGDGKGKESLRFSFYGIAHNADPFPRTMVLRSELTEEAQETLDGTSVEIVEGSGERTVRPCVSGGTIMLEDMQPGENRWVGLAAQVREGNEGQVLPVHFRELVDDEVVNGFTIAAQISLSSTVMLDNLNLQAMEFRRLAVAFETEGAEEVSEAALELFRKGQNLTSDEYLEFLRSHLELMRRVVDDWVQSQEAGDPFDIRIVLEQLTEAGKSDDTLDIALVAATHNQALQKVDAFITMRQKAQGDEADILQMVRWQQQLYSARPLEAIEGSRRVVGASQEFIDSYQAREIGNNAYPRLINSLLDIFRQTSKTGLDLEGDINIMQQCMESPARLQKAHREYLLKLQYLLRLQRLGMKV